VERIIDPSRRRFFRGRVKTVQVMRLPWIFSEEHFTQGCDQCQNCIKACDSNIIIQDESGFPKIDFGQGECTFCDKCIETCPQPLFSNSFTKHNSEEDSKQKPWPVTIEIGDKCLAKNDIYCQSCRDECETNVIKFNYLDSSIPKPSIIEQDCSQCGACLTSCPQDAITFNFINANQ